MADPPSRRTQHPRPPLDQHDHQDNQDPRDGNSLLFEEEESMMLPERLPFSPELMRRLFQYHQQQQQQQQPPAVHHPRTVSTTNATTTPRPIRWSVGATAVAGELLRLWVQEARDRASIEAECEHEATASSNSSRPTTTTTARERPPEEDDDDDQDQTRTPKRSKTTNATTGEVLIRADHITKVAAELLMDFS